MTDSKVKCHRHAVFAFVDMSTIGFVGARVIRLISMKLRSIKSNMSHWTVVKNQCVASCCALDTETFGTCNASSYDVVIEASASK